jgi:TetR/AcrR family transcriptional repressor of bet genes
MPKRGMQPIRRQQLIDATIATIEAHGFAETTIARISQRAGLSAGIVSHYFGGKNALLAATMRWLLSDLRDEMIARQRRGESPIGRIEAIIAANFAPAQFTPRVCAAWLSFYAQVPHEPELARLHRVYIRRLHSNLRHAFGALLPAEATARAAEGMAALIDGIWAQAALLREAPRERAHGLANDYLRMVLQEHGVAATNTDGPDHAVAG